MLVGGRWLDRAGFGPFVAPVLPNLLPATVWHSEFKRSTPLLMVFALDPRPEAIHSQHGLSALIHQWEPPRVALLGLRVALCTAPLAMLAQPDSRRR